MTADILYHDQDIVVLNKQAGLPAYPLSYQDEQQTALNIIAQTYPEVRESFLEELEGGLCHRLDNDTSGILVFARHLKAKKSIRKLFQENIAHREYLAICHGHIQSLITYMNFIAHHPKNKRKMVALGDTKHVYFRGKPQEARTQITPLSYSKLWGGRRHQIRVHLATHGHPLVGDVLYGGQTSTHLIGQALHAYQLKLPDKELITAPIFSDFQAELLDRDFPQIPCQIMIL